MAESSPPPLILIVEDFDDAREMYRDYPEFSGFRTISARDGGEADLVVHIVAFLKLHSRRAVRARRRRSGRS